MISQASPLHENNDIIPWSEAVVGSVIESGIIKALFLEEHYKTHHRYLFPESSSGEILRDSFG